jgi:F-type H+-transporting ATPase subunit gamma
METLETLQRRIGTTEDLRAIVRTMKALSGVSIRQYDQATAALRDYARTVELGLQVLLRGGTPPGPAPALRGRPAIAIVFGSDHGLCGRFNRQIVRFAEIATEHSGLAPADVAYIAVGARAAAQLAARGLQPEEVFPQPSSAEALVGLSHDLLLRIDALRTGRGIERALVFHNARSGRATAAPRRVRLLPLDAAWQRELAERPWPSRRLPAFTMDRAELLRALVGQYLFVVLFRAAAESAASEHATRLATMQAADRNIEDHLDEVRAAYRRRRQDAITEELLDVIAGFEVLRGAPAA